MLQAFLYVNQAGFRYHVGAAQVSAFVLLASGTSTSPSQTVTLHRGPS